MADSTISGLPEILGINVVDSDEFAIVDSSAGTTNKITRAELKKALEIGINSLSDVVITSASTNQALVYNGTNWVNSIIQSLPIGGTAGQVLSKIDSTDGNAQWSNLPAAPFERKTVFLKDVKPDATYGGTFNNNAWRIRDLNAVSGNTSFITLPTDFTNNIHDNNGGSYNATKHQFTLAAGSYLIEWSCPASYVVTHVSKLYNVSDATDQIIGTSEQVNNTSALASTTRSFGCGEVVIASPKTFDIRHRCATSKSTNGFGERNAIGVSEVYTMVKITKIA